MSPSHAFYLLHTCTCVFEGLDEYWSAWFWYSICGLIQDAYYNAIGEEDTFVTDLDYVLNLGVVHAAVNSYSYEWQSPAQTLVWDWICSGHPEVTSLGRVYAPMP
jgi:hypothetical protein